MTEELKEKAPIRWVRGDETPSAAKRRRKRYWKNDLQLEPEKRTENDGDSVATEEEVRANLPNVEEQIERMVEAEEEKPLLFPFHRRILTVYHPWRQRTEQQIPHLPPVPEAGGTKRATLNFGEMNTAWAAARTYPDGTEGHDGSTERESPLKNKARNTNPDLLLSWSKVENGCVSLSRTTATLTQRKGTLRRLSGKRVCPKA